MGELYVGMVFVELCVVTRVGSPEFMGEFDRYLRGLGVEHKYISTAHPRANGLVERYNKSIKEGFRKMM